ncbi:hypothetical protein FDECE_17992 [Fusarium decemcellulare]|nr:hypothetical protein FDECE_17992 [Fusarium decemcellulare]
MEKQVISRALETPGAVAIIDGSHAISYAKLVDKAKAFSSILLEHGLAQDEPVGILFEVGSRQVIAQLAVLLAGGTCVPISPTNPPHRITSLLQDTGIKHVVAEEDTPYLPDDVTLVCLSDVDSLRPTPSLRRPARLRDEHCRTHILFTSGSTGKPKGVQISSTSIMHLATNTPVTPLEAEDRVAAFNDPGFDLSLFEVWVTLINRATIVIIPYCVQS